MKSFSRANLFLSSLLGFAGLSAQAADDSATFWVDHDVLRFESSSFKPDEGDTQKTTDLVTTPTDVTIGIFWKDYGLYVTPGSRGGVVGASFYPSKEVEIGLNLGIDNHKVEDEAVGGTPPTTQTVDEKSSTYGLFGTYYLAVSDKTSAEFTLNINLGSSKETTKVEGAAEVTNSDLKSTQVGLLAQYVFEVAKHFHYVPGIAYVATTLKDEQADADSKVSTLALNIAHFRYIF